MGEVIRIDGLLCLHCYGEAYDILFVSSKQEPLAEVLHEKIARKQVTARYWITDGPCSFEEAQEDFLRRAFGMADTKFGAHYSEITGYLWTDEKAQIGGHNLIAELKNSVGKWLLLEVVVHDDVAASPA